MLRWGNHYVGAAVLGGTSSAGFSAAPIAINLCEMKTLMALINSMILVPRSAGYAIGHAALSFISRYFDAFGRQMKRSGRLSFRLTQSSLLLWPLASMLCIVTDGWFIGFDMHAAEPMECFEASFSH